MFGSGSLVLFMIEGESPTILDSFSHICRDRSCWLYLFLGPVVTEIACHSIWNWRTIGLMSSRFSLSVRTKNEFRHKNWVERERISIVDLVGVSEAWRSSVWHRNEPKGVRAFSVKRDRGFNWAICLLKRYAKDLFFSTSHIDVSDWSVSVQSRNFCMGLSLLQSCFTLRGSLVFSSTLR